MKYIGFFTHMTGQEQVLAEDRRHGEFSLMVEAEGPESAVTMFRDRIVSFRHTRQFFEGVCKIFMVQLLEFDEFPKSGAVMLNYKSTAGDPLMPFISCTIPTDQSDWCRIREREDNWPEIDGKKEQLFIEFEEKPSPPEVCKDP